MATGMERTGSERASDGARPGRRAWAIWWVAVLAYTVAVLNRSAFAATGDAASLRFGVSASALSLLAVVQLAVYAALQVPAGVLVDRYGPRLLIAAGAILVAAGQVALALSSLFWLAVAGRILVGAGDAVTFVSVLRLIPAWFPARRVPMLNQIAGMLGQLGQVASAVPLATFVTTAGWTSAYLATACTAALTAFLALAVLRDGQEKTEGSAQRGGLLEIIRLPSTQLGFWCHFTSPFPANVFGFLWGFPFLTAGQGLSVGTAQALLALFVLSIIATGPIFGGLAARFIHHRPEIIMGSVALQLVSWVAVLAWPGPAPLILLAILACAVGSGDPASVVAFDIARSGVEPGQVGRASGVTNVGGFTSTVLVILLVGVSLDYQGASTPDQWSHATFNVAMLAQAPVWLAGLIGVALARRHLKQSRATIWTSTAPPETPSAPARNSQ